MAAINAVDLELKRVNICQFLIEKLSTPTQIDYLFYI